MSFRSTEVGCGLIDLEDYDTVGQLEERVQ